MDTNKTLHSLLAAAQRKDRSAFESLVERYSVRLQNQISARLQSQLRSRIGVEDILQDTLVRAFEAIEKFRWQGEESFYRWLASIAEHLIRNSVQKKVWAELQIDRDVPARDISPSKDLRRNERFDRLESALGGLSDDQRQAIVLSRIDGLKVKDIAARMGRSEDAVHKLLARAVLRLRKSFGDTESLALPPRVFRMPEDHGNDE